MPALNFQARFAPLVEFGQKRQTIRAYRKDGRDPEVGDRLYLYTGMRTKQCRKLGEATVTSVVAVEIDAWPTIMDGPDDGEVFGTRPWQPRINIGDDWIVSNRRALTLAHRDGFVTVDEMIDWFKETHGLPFDGLLIRWGDIDSTPHAESRRE